MKIYWVIYHFLADGWGGGLDEEAARGQGREWWVKDGGEQVGRDIDGGVCERKD